MRDWIRSLFRDLSSRMDRSRTGGKRKKRRTPLELELLERRFLLSTVSFAPQLVRVAEPASGTSIATFTVNLSPPSTQPVSVTFQTRAGTASANQDYTETNGTLTFNPGDTAKTIPVTIRADTIDEADETFTVQL